MGKKHNPNSRKRHRGKTWSELPSDLLNSVLERLGFADFRRAKSVCTSWYSASRQSVPKNQIPWLILFPEHNTSTSCTLFNPEVKDKLYETKYLGSRFAKSFCLATYGSWFLMRRCNLYIMNIFTKERIMLAPLESQLGTTKIERTDDDAFLISNNQNQRKSKGIHMRSPVFWIDEKTKDYVVIWGLEEFCVVYAKKGDNLWKEIPETSECFDMVYKDHKLYFSSYENNFKIFDFSRDVPQQSFASDLLMYRGHEVLRLSYEPITVLETKLVVTVTGDVLKVERIIKDRLKVVLFFIYKVYSSETFKKHEPVDSLGDEAMLLDLGITVLANGIEGFKKNSIYFSGVIGHYPTEICVYNLATKKMEPLHELDCSSTQLAKARWFLPSFKTKCL